MRIPYETQMNKIRHAMTISRIGIQSEKNFRLAGLWARLAAITDTRFPDYIPPGMKGMAAITDLQLTQTGYLNCRPSNIVVEKGAKQNRSDIQENIP